MTKAKKLLPIVLSLYMIVVFVQSLFFKFTGSPETVHIFTILNNWANTTFGFNGLFLPPGIFNAYVVGTGELITSLLLLAGLLFKKPILSLLGSLGAFGVISGAIFFHLFTPLGIDPFHDGGVLFIMACGIWVSSIILFFIKKKELGL